MRANAQLPTPAAGVTAIVPGSSAPAVEAIPTARFPVATLNRATRKSKYDYTVPANGWLDTGLDVFAGEMVNVATTGDIVMGDQRAATPDGIARGWRDLLRQFPLNSANSGALIGRVTASEASVPFTLGASGTATMPTSGRLFLAVNTPLDLAGTGSYRVKLTFAASTPTAPAGIVTASNIVSPAADISQLLAPALFATIPRRVQDSSGDLGDMVNFALLGTQTQVEAAFAAAGWQPVDKDVQAALLHGLRATLNHEAYTEVPMSSLYLFGRAQDLSFSRADPIQVAARRHHLRVWRTDQTVAGVPLWVGSATHDVGFERDARGKAAGDVDGYTHKIDPDIDLERQFLLDSFDTTGRFRSAAYVTPPDPLRDAKTATGGTFHSDGRILVMALQ